MKSKVGVEERERDARGLSGPNPSLGGDMKTKIAGVLLGSYQTGILSFPRFLGKARFAFGLSPLPPLSLSLPLLPTLPFPSPSP